MKLYTIRQKGLGHRVLGSWQTKLIGIALIFGLFAVAADRKSVV